MAKAKQLTYTELGYAYRAEMRENERLREQNAMLVSACAIYRDLAAALVAYERAICGTKVAP